MNGNITNNLVKNMSLFNNELRADENFDIIYRTISTGGREGCVYFIDGFIKDDMLEKLLQIFTEIKKEDMPTDVHSFSKQYVPYGEVDLVSAWDDILTGVLSGIACLFVDGYETAFMIDCRTYPMRSVEEPEKDKVLKGSKDGFVETLVSNTALIRRRIRSTSLTMEMLQAGRTSKTDIVIAYMDDRVDKELLKTIRDRINNLKVDALTMNQQSLAECLYRHKWYNPFPKFKYSERPDTASASILEGEIIILVDNSPAAMILPTSVFDIIEEANDYYFPPITGGYLRIARALVTFVTLSLTPVWLLLYQNPQYVPEALEFIMVKEVINVPLIIQFLILEIAIDGLKMAAVNTPNMLSTPLSVVAGLVLGDFTVSSGWFNAEVMLYMAFVAVGNYAQASFELGYAIKFLRMLTLILTWAFNIWGFIAGWIITILSIVCNKTVSGKSYIYPLLPFNSKDFAKQFFRKRINNNIDK